MGVGESVTNAMYVCMPCTFIFCDGDMYVSSNDISSLIDERDTTYGMTTVYQSDCTVDEEPQYHVRT